MKRWFGEILLYIVIFVICEFLGGLFNLGYKTTFAISFTVVIFIAVQMANKEKFTKLEQEIKNKS